MDLNLYNAPASTCSQRVRFLLNAKELAFDEVKLDLMAGDQLDPDYLLLNPNGVVPTLVHAGSVVTDSAVINQYLDEVFVERATFTPAGPVARAKMRALLHYIDEMPAAAVRVPTYQLVFLPRFASMTEEELSSVAERKPLRREFLLSLGRKGFDADAMEAALSRLSRSFDRFAHEIDACGGPWLMGPRMTLPDISLMPVLVRMHDLGFDWMWERHRSLSRWYDSIRSHPAFQATYYPGSLLSEQYPDLKPSWLSQSRSFTDSSAVVVPEFC